MAYSQGPVLLTGNNRQDITKLMDMAIAKNVVYGKLKELPLRKNTLNRQLYHGLWKRLQKIPDSVKRGASEDSEFAQPIAKQAKGCEELGSETQFDLSTFENLMPLMDPAEISSQNLNPEAIMASDESLEVGQELQQYDAPAAINLNPTDLDPIEDFGAWLEEFDEAHGLNEVDVNLDRVLFGNRANFDDNWNDLLDITA